MGANVRTRADLKSAARKIFLETLAAIDIRERMFCKLAPHGTRLQCGDAVIDLAAFSKILAIAFGKASVAMAEALLALLPPGRSATGVIVAPAVSVSQSGIPAQTPRAPNGFKFFLAGHPIPSEQSFAAARAILDLLATCDERTVVFFLLSGGGSVLVELPLDPAVSLADVQSLNKLLVGCGASIEEINAVRKHLSAVKGGRLAAAACSATKFTLAITDVPEGRESALASGPTLPDPSTIADVRRIAREYALLEKFPASVRGQFEKNNALLETPKEGDAAFRNSYFEILLGMHDLFHHTHIAAEGEGFLCICDNSTDDWPLERAAEYLLAQLAKLRRDYPTRCVAVIADGELSSPVRGAGTGGRNAAFVLECVERIAGQEVAVMSVGTDGIDGNSPAAGTIADGSTLDRARAANLDVRDFAARSDSYNFFSALGDAVVTGPAGNNLRDLRLLLALPLREAISPA
jgi:hydroxypyruvate reductase